MHKKIVLVVISLIILLSFLWYFFVVKQKPNNVAGVTTDNKKSEQNIKGVILPHHNLAVSLIDQSLNRLNKNNNYSQIVILGPNHYFADKYPLVTASTVDGVTVNTEAVNKITSVLPQIVDSPLVINNDHSVTTVIPYLNKYYPNAKVIPILFSPANTLDRLNKLASFLAVNLPKDTLVLASIDFSHGSSVLRGLDNNKETISVLSSFKYNQLLKFDDDHLDSPDAVAVLLIMMQKYNTTNWNTWFSSHASIIKNDPSLSGTSYVIGVFY